MNDVSVHERRVFSSETQLHPARALRQQWYCFPCSSVWPSDLITRGTHVITERASEKTFAEPYVSLLPPVLPLSVRHVLSIPRTESPYPQEPASRVSQALTTATVPRETLRPDIISDENVISRTLLNYTMSAAVFEGECLSLISPPAVRPTFIIIVFTFLAAASERSVYGKFLRSVLHEKFPSHCLMFPPWSGSSSQCLFIYENFYFYFL